jgi:hypothetical protein
LLRRAKENEEAARRDASGRFSFAQRSWQTRLFERKEGYPDQREDNPNRKGVIGNGEV